MTIMNKQWQNVVNIHRVNLLKYKEIKPTDVFLLFTLTTHPSNVLIKLLSNNVKITAN